tara:strand:- start:2180 stop:2449 length:270 start_codon:yes stop_codon:yes gene_type:complete
MNKEQATKLLNAGYSISQVAEELQESNKKLYALAKKNKLPYNAPIQEGGPKENRILRLYKSGFSCSDIGRIFSQAPQNIKQILKRNKLI